MILLNVGSGGGRAVPNIFKGWEQHTLDIDPRCKPDIVCDAKELSKVRTKYDAVFNSHNIEHFYKHEVGQVLAGFLHVLKPKGFAYVTCPDMAAVFEAARKMDINDTLYMSSGGPITIHDVIYGWGLQVKTGNHYYAHKTGFTQKSLGKALREAGFKKVMVASDEAYNLHAYAFKDVPEKATLKKLGL